jgi:hypothetical protein
MAKHGDQAIRRISNRFTMKVYAENANIAFLSKGGL